MRRLLGSCGGVAGALIPHWCPAETLVELRDGELFTAQARRLEFDIIALRVREQLTNTWSVTAQPTVRFMPHQHVSGPTSIRNNNRAALRRTFGTSDILIELTTGQSVHGSAYRR